MADDDEILSKGLAQMQSALNELAKFTNRPGRIITPADQIQAALNQAQAAFQQLNRFLSGERPKPTQPLTTKYVAVDVSPKNKGKPTYYGSSIPTPNEFCRVNGYSPFPSKFEAWLNSMRDAIASAQPMQGQNTSVYVRQGKGTVIDVQRAAGAGPPPATGACCAGDGTCTVMTESDCADAGGAYQGDGTTCDPNPCCPDITLDVTVTGTLIVVAHSCCVSTAEISQTFTGTGTGGGAPCVYNFGIDDIAGFACADNPPDATGCSSDSSCSPAFMTISFTGDPGGTATVMVVAGPDDPSCSCEAFSTSFFTMPFTNGSTGTFTDSGGPVCDGSFWSFEVDVTVTF